MNRLWRMMLAIAVAGPPLVLSGMIALGKSAPPAERSSINAPFRSVDFSDMPQLRRLEVSGTSPIAYRHYGPASAREVVVALHGSTGSSSSMHPMARFLAQAGMMLYVPDLRGHGATGARGDVDYLGQPDDDLQALVAFVRKEHPATRLTLIGFSLGGGLALRAASGSVGAMIDRTLLLAPAFGGQAPTMRRGGDDPWARPHVPRILALSLLNRLGVHALGQGSARHGVDVLGRGRSLG